MSGSGQTDVGAFRHSALMNGVFRLTEAERGAVMRAYQTAARAKEDAASCYFAAIDALHRMRPDVSRQLIAQEAVRIITTDVRFIEIIRERRA